MQAKIVGLHISQGGVPKSPVDDLLVSYEGCLGDSQNDLKHHGGESKAVCLFQAEIIEKLSSEGHYIYPGSTGENILIQGIKLGMIKPGSIIKFPNLQLQITQDAPPCKTIKSSFIDGDFTKISHKKNPNYTRWYAKVIQNGNIRIGDSVLVLN